MSFVFRGVNSGSSNHLLTYVKWSVSGGRLGPILITPESIKVNYQAMLEALTLEALNKFRSLCSKKLDSEEPITNSFLVEFLSEINNEFYRLFLCDYHKAFSSFDKLCIDKDKSVDSGVQQRVREYLNDIYEKIRTKRTHLESIILNEYYKFNSMPCASGASID